MPRGGYAAKVDANQPEIVALLRFCGYPVALLSKVGDGVPDLLVAIGWLNVLFEVKVPGEKLNAAQERWHDSWPGEKYVVRSRSDALRLAVMIERREAAKMSFRNVTHG